MKFTSIALMTFVGFVAANPIVQEDAQIFADGPVTVTVSCNGNVVWTKLSLLELTTAGKVLVDSYNAIHALVNDDDSQLRDLVFSGKYTRSMLEGGEDATLDKWFKPRVSKGTSNDRTNERTLNADRNIVCRSEISYLMPFLLS